MKPLRLALFVTALLLTPPWAGAQSTAPSGTTAQTQDNMNKMQQQMDKIRATKDPKARQKLMEEHMQTMQQTMKMMRGAGGAAASGQGEHGGMGKGGQKGGMAAGDDMKARQDTMEKRMDMMMMMMEQMMQRDQMQSAPMGHM